MRLYGHRTIYSGTITDQIRKAISIHDRRVLYKLIQLEQCDKDEFPCTYPDWLEKRMKRWAQR